MPRSGRAVAVLGGLLLLAGCGDGDAEETLVERAAPAAPRAEEAGAALRPRARAAPAEPTVADEIESHLEVLREGLSGDVRDRAVAALVRLGAAAVPRLAGALRSPAEPRCEIAIVLEAIGPPARGAIPELGRLVREGEREGSFAFDALVAIGPEGVAAIERMLRAGPEDVQWCVLGFVSRPGRRPVPSLLPALERLAASGEPELRAYAIDAYAQTARGREGGHVRLVEWLRDENPIIRAAAAGGLGDIGADARNALPALVLALADDADEVRYRAAMAVRALGADADSAIPALQQMARSEADHGWVAVAALRSIGGAEAIEALMHGANETTRCLAIREAACAGADDAWVARVLEAGLADPNAAVRAAALAALNEQPGVPASWQGPLVRLLGDEREELRRMAAAALARTGAASEATVTALLSASADPAASVRAAALDALSRSATADSHLVAQAVSALRDPDAQVVEAACRALGRAEGEASSAVPDLRSLVTSGAPRVRVAAAFALVRLETSPEAAYAALRQLEVHDDWRVRLAVVEALAERRRPESVPILVSRLDDRSPQIRIAAARAIAGFGADGAAAVPLLERMSKSRDVDIARAAAAALAAIRR